MQERLNELCEILGEDSVQRTVTSKDKKKNESDEEEVVGGGGGGETRNGAPEAAESDQ